MKGATMVATLERLGVLASFSRPSVSNDNPFSEALFRTLKYCPDYPTQPFADLGAARTWVAAFVRVVQHAAFAQRHSLCHARRSARGTRRRLARRSSRRLRACPTPDARALERRPPQLGFNHHRPSESRARRTRRTGARRMTRHATSILTLTVGGWARHFTYTGLAEFIRIAAGDWNSSEAFLPSEAGERFDGYFQICAIPRCNGRVLPQACT